MNTIERRRQMIKTMLESTEGRFASVTFRKKDGSIRTMVIQPAANKYHIKGEAASQSAKKAVETRKANFPNLYNVIEAFTKQFKSIDLDTIEKIKINGATFTLQ